MGGHTPQEFFNVQVLGELRTSVHFTIPGGGWCYRDVLTGDEGVSQAHHGLTQLVG